MTYIPDIIEQGERAAEDHLEKATEGVPDGQYRCECGRIVPMKALYPSSPNPYSAGICGHCAFGDAYDEEP